MKISIEEIRLRVISEINKDPFAESGSWRLIKEKLPEQYWSFLIDRAGHAAFLKELPSIFSKDIIGGDAEAQRCWEIIGNFYKNQNRLYEATSIYISLYNQLLDYQEKTKKRVHKGVPLVWISDCYYAMGFPVLAKRCLMLALCENAIHEKGVVPVETTGTYWRLVYRHGLLDTEISRYAAKAYKLSEENEEITFFPE